jgi:hypothetical protein
MLLRLTFEGCSMSNRSSRCHFRATGQSLESRLHPGALGLTDAALGLYNSPAGVAVQTAATAYHVGQLAWSGHTNLLLGSVQVSQPYPLKGIWGHAHDDVRPELPHRLALPQIHLAPPHIPFLGWP